MEDFERCYRAVKSRDLRFDGWFFTAVTSTGIYCRPSCPATTPKRENVRFYPTAAAAQQGGFRACLRCRPDASPGSPEWLGRADVVARAMKLIMDGVVDREGVGGLARRLGYGERQLHRVLVEEVGTGALCIARAQRAQTARLLLESTELPVSQVAFGAGFASIRQFNETVKDVFGRTPSQLRQSTHKGNPRSGPEGPSTAQSIELRLAHRMPFAAENLMSFIGQRAVAGIETYDGVVYARSLMLPHAQATAELSSQHGYVRATLKLADVRDLTSAVTRLRHLCNLDADPIAIDEALGADRVLRPLVRRTPGLRVPGTCDGFETAVRAIVGQQISVGGARTVVARLVEGAGAPLPWRAHNQGAPHSKEVTLVERPSRTFPTPAALGELIACAPRSVPMPSARRATLLELCQAVENGKLVIDPGANPVDLTRALLSIKGIGNWTASYIAMRAIGDPDAFPATDLGLRRGFAALGLRDDPASVAEVADRWRPWRAYAVMHLWSVPHTATTPLRKQEKVTTHLRRQEKVTAALRREENRRSGGRP